MVCFEDVDWLSILKSLRTWYSMGVETGFGSCFSLNRDRVIYAS